MAHDPEPRRLSWDEPAPSDLFDDLIAGAEADEAAELAEPEPDQ
jgi:hypothetical protein